jgi:hypothetical protein
MHYGLRITDQLFKSYVWLLHFFLITFNYFLSHFFSKVLLTYFFFLDTNKGDGDYLSPGLEFAFKYVYFFCVMFFHLHCSVTFIFI